MISVSCKVKALMRNENYTSQAVEHGLCAHGWAWRLDVIDAGRIKLAGPRSNSMIF